MGCNAMEWNRINTPTCSGFAEGLNLLAHTKKMSGCGLPFMTSGSSPSTMWVKRLKNSLWRLVFISKVKPAELVATAIGMPCLLRWLTSFSIPKINSVYKLRLKMIIRFHYYYDLKAMSIPQLHSASNTSSTLNPTGSFITWHHRGSGE